MIDIIYHFKIFMCLAIALILLLVQTAPRLSDRHYRNGKLFLALAAIILAVSNALVLCADGFVFVELLAAPVLVVAQLQACMFTFLVLTLFHSAYVSKGNILRHLLPTIGFVVLYVPTAIFFPMVTLPLRGVFAVVYLAQIIIYVRLFKRQRREYIAKIDNYFSDTNKYTLRWASRMFYQACSIGIVVLVFSIFPSEVFDGVLTLMVTGFYFWFAVQFINYQYRLLEAIPAVVVAEEALEVKSQKRAEGDDTLLKEIELLELYLQHGVVLSDYAKAVGIPSRKLSSYINSTRGVSFNQWVNAKRVEYAKKQIEKHPDYTMERIAELSGFAHKSHFCRIFREVTGQSFLDHKNS